jgi:formamidopyrimidine-DNA glycosylase
VARSLPAKLEGHRIDTLGRRAKYLLFGTAGGTLIVHLGMSGSLRFLDPLEPPGAHDHIDIGFEQGGSLRFNDPRRFGSLHFSTLPERHRLLRDLGPEPFSEEFTTDYLWSACRNRRVAIKQHLMNGRIVVGLGNIYANEALYRAGIHPARLAGRVGRERLGLLVASIRDVLNEAIGNGGTTLRDFIGGDGRPGYFQLSLKAYDRLGEPCERCGAPIRRAVLGQRATYYCARCQR